MPATFRSADATRPAQQVTAVTPSDVTILPVTRSLYIGTGGTVEVTMAGDGGIATFTNVANGTFLPVQVTQVRAATTATAILAIY